VAIEAGAAAQNLLLQATAAGLGATLIGAFDEAALRRTVAEAAGLSEAAVRGLAVRASPQDSR
jgi:nitroreductase